MPTTTNKAIRLPAIGEAAWGSILNSQTFVDIDNIFNASGYLKPSDGGTGLNTSASSGVPSINAGTWAVNNVLTTNRLLYAAASNTITSSANLTYNGTLFDVEQARAADATGIRIGTNSGTGVSADVLSIDFYQRNSTPGTTLSARVAAVAVDAGGFDGGLAFYATQGGTSGERVRIKGSAGVGINQTDPTAQLHVVSGAAGRVAAIISSAATPTADILRVQDNGTNRVVVASTGGIQVGAPTGGDQGTGTINVATNIFKNGTAYNNPHGGFEYAYTGKLVKYSERMVAMGLANYHPLSLEELESYTREHYHFPYLGDNEHLGLFDGSERLLLITEELAVHLFRLHHRIASLESEVAQLRLRVN